jgi:hypothetical protein
MTSSPNSRVTYSRELPDKFGLTIVPVEHISWKGDLLLDPASHRATKFLSGAQGMFELRDKILQIIWDDRQVDTFFFDGSRYRHSSLIEPGYEAKVAASKFWRG